MASIEGEMGFPMQMHPFSAERGLRGMPTIINNVKTLANIPGIINKSADWCHSYNICFLGAVRVEDRTKTMTDKVIASEAKQSTLISSK